MNSPVEIHYLRDADVDDALDRELRALLSTCFTKPQDHVFRERRYFNTPPAHRWIIRDEATGLLVAHLAVHDRVVMTDNGDRPAGGIAEVCVHPTHQGRGYLRRLVATAHDWMTANGYAYSVLYGEPRYYASSGYVSAPNLEIDVRGEDGSPVRGPVGGALVAPLAATPWPTGPGVYMPGLIF